MSALSAGFLLAAGIALLIAGGEAVVRGAAALARHLGVPPLVVGLTVVAFGTSAPELAVNVTAAAKGNGGVAFGNLIGSNIANIGLVLACVAMIRSLNIESTIITREIPMMLLASVATLVMGMDSFRMETDWHYDRAEGFTLLLFFAVFLYYTVAETLRRRPADTLVQQAREQPVGNRIGPLGGSVAIVIVGLAGLIAGGRLTVDAAVEIATAFGVSKDLIGFTIVAVGTSLPEFSASLIAARRGEADLAIGNIVGSNIFNLLFVLGVTAVIHPVPVPEQGGTDLAAMVAIAAVLLLLSMTLRRISRSEGALLLAAYLGYVGWRIF